jgi:hypothetical protein
MEEDRNITLRLSEVRSVLQANINLLNDDTKESLRAIGVIQ